MFKSQCAQIEEQHFYPQEERERETDGGGGGQIGRETEFSLV
jgi:hypothetical protein